MKLSEKFRDFECSKCGKTFSGIALRNELLPQIGINYWMDPIGIKCSSCGAMYCKPDVNLMRDKESIMWDVNCDCGKNLKETGLKIIKKNDRVVSLIKALDHWQEKTRLFTGNIHKNQSQKEFLRGISTLIISIAALLYAFSEGFSNFYGTHAYALIGGIGIGLYSIKSLLLGFASLNIYKSHKTIEEYGIKMEFKCSECDQISEIDCRGITWGCGVCGTIHTDDSVLRRKVEDLIINGLCSTCGEKNAILDRNILVYCENCKKEVQATEFMYEIQNS